MSSPLHENGMGSNVTSSGVAFRVWAPNAESVCVVGSFNNWVPRKDDALQSECDGYWYGIVSDAKVRDEYRYQIVNGDTFTRIDPYSRAVTNSNGNSVIVDPSSYKWQGKFNPAPWNNAVIYELHVGSFVAHTGKNRKKSAGTFRDAMCKLEYLANLGVNVIEVLPIHQFPGEISWGYNPAHLFAVESKYGSPDDFKAFVDMSHQLGMAVVLDVVYNHVGPDDCGIWRFDGWFEGNGGGGIYFYQDGRSETPWTMSGRPDFGRTEVRQYLRDNAIMWMTEYGVDGLRVDSVSHIRNIHGNDNSPTDDIPDGWTFLQWLSDEKNRLKNNKILIAEDLCCNEAITNHTADGGAGADTQWDKDFCDTVRDALAAVNDDDRDMESLARVINACYSGHAMARVIYTESHDEAKEGIGRVPKIVQPGRPYSYLARKRATLGAVLAMTSPGIPMLLQGQELLEIRHFGSDQMLNWRLLKKNQGIYLLFQDLIRLRRNKDGYSVGLTGEDTKVFKVDNEAKTLAYIRSDRGGVGDDVVVVLNFRNQSYDEFIIGLPSEGAWKVRVTTDDIKYGPDFGKWVTSDVIAENNPADGFAFSGKIKLAPYSAVILSQDPD